MGTKKTRPKKASPEVRARVRRALKLSPDEAMATLLGEQGDLPDGRPYSSVDGAMARAREVFGDEAWTKVVKCQETMQVESRESYAQGRNDFLQAREHLARAVSELETVRSLASRAVTAIWRHPHDSLIIEGRSETWGGPPEESRALPVAIDEAVGLLGALDKVILSRLAPARPVKPLTARRQEKRTTRVEGSGKMPNRKMREVPGWMDRVALVRAARAEGVEQNRPMAWALAFIALEMDPPVADEPKSAVEWFRRQQEAKQAMRKAAKV